MCNNYYTLQLERASGWSRYFWVATSLNPTTTANHCCTVHLSAVKHGRGGAQGIPVHSLDLMINLEALLKNKVCKDLDPELTLNFYNHTQPASLSRLTSRGVSKLYPFVISTAWATTGIPRSQSGGNTTGTHKCVAQIHA